MSGETLQHICARETCLIIACGSRCLNWENGCTAPPDRERLGPEWGWWCTPLEEWCNEGAIVVARGNARVRR